MNVVQVTATGEEHGLINILPNSVPDDDFKHADPKIKEKLRKQRKKHAEMVKVRYINHEEGPTGRWKNTYCKYAGDPLRQYNLIHDHEYELPYGLVEQINEAKKTQLAGLQSVDGRNVQSDGNPLQKDKKITVHECVPASFF